MDILIFFFLNLGPPIQTAEGAEGSYGELRAAVGRFCLYDFELKTRRPPVQTAEGAVGS